MKPSPQSPPRYWRSLDEHAQTRGFEEFVHREFPQHASEWLETLDRRAFLKTMGASLAFAGLTACTRQPEERIVPYVKQPEEMIPGKALSFATAVTLSGYAVGLLAESHEGHPTKIEGNPDHPMSLGAANIFHHASLLDLYDPTRAQAIRHGGEISNWEKFISELHDVLASEIKTQGRGLRILTETVNSPTLHAQIKSILAKYPGARWHQYEPINQSNVHEGSRLAFGQVVATHHHFDQANIILALDSDFMFSHPAALRYARDFASRRRGGRGDMSRFYAVESTPSVTGVNADHRLALSTTEIDSFVTSLAQVLEKKTAPEEKHEAWIWAVAEDLQKNRGRSIVIAGENQSPQVHALVHRINDQLGNIGRTINYTTCAEAEPVDQIQSLRELTLDLDAGKVDLLLILGGNPVHNAPADLNFAQALAKSPFRVHLSSFANETSSACAWHIPENHYLESWSDARAFDGTVSIVQPLIIPLYSGKSAHELLDGLNQNPERSDYDIVRAHWQNEKVWPDFEKGWRKSVHDGVLANSASQPVSPKLRETDLPKTASSSSSLEIIFRPDPTLWDGRFTNNGWLQELPKPITKICWDSPALINPALAEAQSLVNGDVITLESGEYKMTLPVWITPGQAEKTITAPLGYALRTSKAFFQTTIARLTRTGKQHPLTTTQEHHAIDSAERQIYRETTLAAFLANADIVKQTSESPDKQRETLFKPAPVDSRDYRWGMSIDLSACIGCNACVLACQSENNIPVVGKEQVARHREMQWIRIDTYFSGPPAQPQFNHQPVPCMHCENAPCEVVCPVAATVHDHEGLNLQIYNRCIGTRYCSNNCPYKVRRFNFLQYADYKTPSLKSLRNPDVTVRWRGVMEKCTYCIQRISSARINAKEQSRPIRDGEVRTACQQSCPAQAIVFGDLSDSNSAISKMKTSPLDFSMLGELNTQPRTTYLAKVRNPNPELERTPHA